MKIYLCGPIRKKPNYNLEAFWTVTQELRSLKHEVVCPLELDFMDGTAVMFDRATNKSTGFATYDEAECKGFNQNHIRVYMGDCNDDKSHQYLMKRDLGALLRCDAVVMLPGYTQSAGGTKERITARLALIPTYEVPDFVYKFNPDYIGFLVNELAYTEDVNDPLDRKYGEF